MTLDRDLARRLASAGKKAEAWRKKRDDLIREAARDGASLREIAAAVGLSNPGVLRVLRRTVVATDAGPVVGVATEHSIQDPFTGETTVQIHL